MANSPPSFDAPPLDTAQPGRRFPCARCGAQLEFAPGTEQLVCRHCGATNPIPRSTAPIEERDYLAQLRALRDRQPATAHTVVKCDSCAAEIEKPAEVAALKCPYCGADIVTREMTRQMLNPQAVLPFRVDAANAKGAFKKWLGSLWFAPNALKRYARLDASLSGIYVPFWTYDCRTISDYTGMRGDDYWVPQTYTVTVNGRPQTRTRMVRKTRWRPVSGTVRNTFDDVLVLASRSLPRDHADEIAPWDLHEALPYRDEYLSGFLAETYQVEVDDGFEEAKVAMKGTISATVIRDIGGDHQRIHSLDTRYFDITFKHVLLPIWLSAYRFKQKVYRFLVNARTGEVRGDRPWSWLKITLAVLGAAAVVGTGAYLWVQYGNR